MDKFRLVPINKGFQESGSSNGEKRIKKTMSEGFVNKKWERIFWRAI
jgi:hypothetical protein